MAAKTPTTVMNFPIGGGLMKEVVYFSDIDANDTWVTGADVVFEVNIIGSEAITATAASGTVTFLAGTNATAYVTIIHN